MGSQRTNANPYDSRQLDKSLRHLGPYCLAPSKASGPVLPISPQQEYPCPAGHWVPSASSAAHSRAHRSALGPWLAAPSGNRWVFLEESSTIARTPVAVLCPGAESGRARLEPHEAHIGQQYSEGYKGSAPTTVLSAETTPQVATTATILHQRVRASMDSVMYPFTS